MRKAQYNYSQELAAPLGSINCNRRNPIVALRERKSIAQHRRAVTEYLPPDGIIQKTKEYRSADGENVPFYLLEKSTAAEQPTPCIVYFHGGGFMMPLQVMMLQNAAYYAMQTGYKVFLPEYRYAPQADCKMILEDCFYMVLHLKRYGQDYGVDPDCMILYGDSAGGALAASVTHLMRDRGLPTAAGQMLIYPATDHHSERYGSMEEYKYAVWPKKSNEFMWNYYLRGADPRMIPYASPMNMERFHDLPPAYVEPQEMDVLRDEGIAYAKRLERAGSLWELNIIPGSYHGFDSDHTSPLVQRVLAHRCDVMRQLCEAHRTQGKKITDNHQICHTEGSGL